MLLYEAQCGHRTTALPHPAAGFLPFRVSSARALGHDDEAADSHTVQRRLFPPHSLPGRGLSGSRDNDDTIAFNDEIILFWVECGRWESPRRLTNDSGDRFPSTRFSRSSA